MSTISDAQRIQRISSWLARACLLLVVTLPFGVAAYWVLADAGALAVRANLAPQAIQPGLPGWQRWLAAALTCVPVLLLCRGLWRARECFSAFARGQVFTTQAVRCLRQFSAWVMASVAASLVVTPLVSVVLTAHHPAGQHMLALAFGSDQVFTLFFAAMVWLMAAVIGQGQALAEDNAGFV